MANGSNLSTEIKIIDIDLTRINSLIEKNVREGRALLPVVDSVTGPRPGALCEEIIEALVARAHSCDRESLYANYNLTFFKNGEKKTEYNGSIAGHKVFIVLDFPMLEETPATAFANSLLLDSYMKVAREAAEAARGGSEASEVHLIMPNHADARQDQRHGERGPVTVAIDAIELAPYFDSITSLHLHSPQTEGIYVALGVRFRNLSPNEMHGPSFVCRDPDTLEPISPKNVTLEGVTRLFDRICVASPDVGGAKVARNFIKYSRKLAAALIEDNQRNLESVPETRLMKFIPGLVRNWFKSAKSDLAQNTDRFSYTNILKALPDIPLVVIDKSRPSANESEIMNVLGIEHSKGRDCTLFDDMGDGLGTLVNAAEALIDEGASSVEGRISHGYFSGNAVELVHKSRIKQIVVGNGMALRDSALAEAKINVIGFGHAFAQVIIDIVTKPTPNIEFATRHTRDPRFRRGAGRFAGPMLDTIQKLVA